MCMTYNNLSTPVQSYRACRPMQWPLWPLLFTVCIKRYGKSFPWWGEGYPIQEGHAGEVFPLSPEWWISHKTHYLWWPGMWALRIGYIFHDKIYTNQMSSPYLVSDWPCSWCCSSVIGQSPFFFSFILSLCFCAWWRHSAQHSKGVLWKPAWWAPGAGTEESHQHHCRVFLTRKELLS